MSAFRPALVAGAAAVLLATACASEDPVEVTPLDPGGASTESAPAEPAPEPTAGPSTEPPAGAPLAAELTLTVDDGAGAVTTHTLTCEPVGGDLPDPQAACDAVAAVGSEGFAPPKQDQTCTMIFGGPQTATASGTVGGQPVTTAFSRSNGCEIDRWNTLESLLGRVDS